MVPICFGGVLAVRSVYKCLIKSGIFLKLTALYDKTSKFL